VLADLQVMVRGLLAEHLLFGHSGLELCIPECCIVLRVWASARLRGGNNGCVL